MHKDMREFLPINLDKISKLIVKNLVSEVFLSSIMQGFTFNIGSR